MPEQDGHDSACEAELTSHGYTPCRCYERQVMPSEVSQLTKDLSDYRQIALSYEAQVEQQAQQIGALRAEQARLTIGRETLVEEIDRLMEEAEQRGTEVEQLRAENERLKAELTRLSVVIVEGVSGTWYYHLARPERQSTAFCGAPTMRTSAPLSTWGFKGHLGERYCAACERICGMPLPEAPST